MDAARTVWVPDAGWTIRPDERERRCRMRGCESPAVATLWRRTRGSLPRPWSYCEEHLYGRRIIDGTVHVRVAEDSPAARAGSASPITAMDFSRAWRMS